MKPRALIIAWLAAGAAASPGHAADAPKERYDTSMTCAAIIGAAIEQGDLPSYINTARAAPLRTVYVRQAQNLGQAAGRTDEAVTADIDCMHRIIVATMNVADPAKAIVERADTAAMTANCAALFGLELERNALPSR